MTQPPLSTGYPSQPQPPQGNGLATASFVVGIVALCVSIVLFCVPFLGALIGIVAIILGAVAMGQAKNTPSAGRARVGLILGIIAVVISIAIFVAARAGMSFLGSKSHQWQQQMQNQVDDAKKKLDEQQRQHQIPSTQPAS